MIPFSSPAVVLMSRLVAAFGADAHRVLDLALDELPVMEAAALAYDWGLWARPKQMPPQRRWRSWGFLTGRGFGKTKSILEFINGEVAAGRAQCIGLAAQNETKTIDVQVNGLVDASPPWFKPKFHASAMELHWPNGAIAYAHTPEAPDAIRSHNLDLAWMSELQSWPAATREEAYMNFRFATRIGHARTVWDATPKRRHPILTKLLARAAADPDKHVVVRGSIYENAANLGEGVVADLESEYAGTQKGREELDGQMLDEDEDGLVKQASIDAHRLELPRIARSGIGIDPAVTTREGSDRTGINFSSLGVDGRLYVRADLSGKHEPEAWAAIVLDTYVNEGCDIVVVETNKGGNLLTQNLRAAAKERRIRVLVVDDKWRPHREAGVVFVREIFSRGEKADRARPLATAYQRGRVSHVKGADLSALEEILTTWVPQAGHRSPDPLEALVHIGGELLGLSSGAVDPKVGFEGVRELSAELTKSPSTQTTNLAAFLRSLSERGGRL